MASRPVRIVSFTSESEPGSVTDFAQRRPLAFVLRGLSIFAGVGLAYLLLWPVGDFEPVAYDPPAQAAPYEINAALANLEILSPGVFVGPEDVAVDRAGRAYAATLNGDIVRFSADRKTHEIFVNTGGRPLGLVFDAAGDLIVADPYRGLLRVRADRSIEVLVAPRDPSRPANSATDGLCYINNVDVGPDGVIYFTNSSDRFCPADFGGTYPASLYDIIEHRATGGLFAYDPNTREVRRLLGELQFANGVAVVAGGDRLFVVETGACRVLVYHLRGQLRGTAEPLLEATPGYPDNLTRGLDGRYWLGFTKPRSALMDALARRPFLRKMLIRLPRSWYPVPAPFGHVIAFRQDGEIVRRLTDADPQYPDTTGVTETPEGLYIHSLHADGLGWLEH